MHILTEHTIPGRAHRSAMPREATPLPAEGEVHLWLLPGEGAASYIAACAAVLSPSERTRERAFRTRGDADRFVAAHGGLRHVLASYTGYDASALPFAPGGGKPSLESRCTGADIRFNMSHSGPVVLVAVAAGREVGVDVERTGLPIDIGAIAAICFCDAERTLLSARAGTAREELFYAIWTRKEAYVKAAGGGMALDLPAIDVSSAPALIEGRWHVSDISIPPGGYRGALASDGPVSRVTMFDRSRTGTPC